MANTSLPFSEWLQNALDKKGWKQSDLARAAHLGKGSLSDIVSGRRKVGIDVARSIAEALKIPPEQVLRAAGMLPPENEDPWADEMSHKLTQLSPGLRSMAERLINSMVEQEEAEQKKNAKPKTRSAKA
jgi:transcriptional regulator with XRE-family HTH domain